MTKQQMALLMTLRPKLGRNGGELAYSSLARYNRTGDWPTALCLKIERMSKGAITAASLSPKEFRGVPAHQTLAKNLLDYFISNTDAEVNGAFIHSLNFLQDQVPDVYKKLMARIEKEDDGIRFIKLRNMHQDANDNTSS